MKTIITLPLLFVGLLFLTQCKKNDPTPPLAITSIEPASAPVGETVTISGTSFSTDINSIALKFNGTNATITSATTTQLVTTIPAGATTGKISLTINGAGIESPEDYEITDTWSQMTNFTGVERSLGAAFSINGKGYLGACGYYADYTNAKDFWEYDPATNAWTQKADFPGTSRQSAVSFAIGNKGYIGTGFSGTARLKDFWEYDPATNTWTQKEDFGGVTRDGATGFSIGSKGYIGTGQTTGPTTMLNDFWEYDQGTGHWTKKADFTGAPRRYAFGATIGSKGYIGGGNDPNAFVDFYEYNPSSNEWTKKANATTNFVLSPAFAVNSKAFVQVNETTFYEYDANADKWTRRANVPGPALYSIALTIGDYGYLGLGKNQAGTSFKTFYRYSPIK